MLTEIMQNRTISSFGPMSIGTAIALTAIFEPFTSDEPLKDKTIEKFDLNKVGLFYINIATLIRNAVEALDHTSKNKLLTNFKDKQSHIIVEEAIRTEIEIISSLTNKVEFFIFDYKKLIKEHKYINNLNTIAAKVNYIVEEVEKLFLPYMLEPKKISGLLLTHRPIDLILVNSRVFLLESHTGKVKRKIHWGTKLKKYGANNDLSHLPLSIETLKVFGDGWLIKPMVNSKDKNIKKCFYQKSKELLTPLSSSSQIKKIIGECIES